MSAIGNPTSPVADTRLISGGFTLLELLLVLMIATMVLSLAPPLTRTLFPGLELESTARRIASHLRLTRAIAIADGQDALWMLDTAENRYQIETQTALQVESTTNTEAQAARWRGSIPTGIKTGLLTTMSEQQAAGIGGIRFYPDGSSSGGRVLLQRDRKGVQVGVDWLSGSIIMAPWLPSS